MEEPVGVAEQTPSKILELLPYLAWITALVSMVVSLFFSEVMDLPPCILCWYQRIAMYPLVFIIGVGIATRDSRMNKYALPLALAGVALAIYHNLLYFGFIPESITPCSEGASCSSRQLELFGFITIPLLSLGGFVAITASLLLHKFKED
jgi:disulfide bond formation protein DsbB